MKRLLCWIGLHRWIPIINWTPKHLYWQDIRVCVWCEKQDWSNAK